MIIVDFFEGDQGWTLKAQVPCLLLRRQKKCRAKNCATSDLLSNTKATNNVEVTIGLDLTEVVQQPTAPSNQANQTTLGGVIFFVRTHVFG